MHMCIHVVSDVVVVYDAYFIKVCNLLQACVLLGS